MTVRWRDAAAAALCAAWLAAPGAHGQLLPPPETAPAPGPAPAASFTLQELQRLVDNLDSGTLRERLDAARALRERPEFALGTIEGVLRTAELSPEQHRQLVAVAWERFKTDPRPAMGIQSSYNQRGAVLQAVTAGFPAQQVLKAGDRIEVAEGVKLDEFNTLRNLILSRDPGDEMALTILRDGELLNVTVKLGRLDDLRAQPLTEPELMTAFRHYRARDYLELADGQEPLSSGLEPDAWLAAEMGTPDAGDLTYVDFGEIDGTQSPMPVVAGGEPRGTLIMARPGRINARGMNEAEVELRMLNGFRQQLERDIENNKLRLADPKTPEATKDALRALNARNERHLVIYRDLIRQRIEEQRRGR